MGGRKVRVAMVEWAEKLIPLKIAAGSGYVGRRRRHRLPCQEHSQSLLRFQRSDEII